MVHLHQIADLLANRAMSQSVWEVTQELHEPSAEHFRIGDL